MIHDTRPGNIVRRALAACAALALVTWVIVVAQGGARGTRPAPNRAEPLWRTEQSMPVPTRQDTAALDAVPDPTHLIGVAPPTVRVAVASEADHDSHAHLARLDIVVRAEGQPVSRASVALQGIGGVFPAPGTALDDDDRLLTDEHGCASVFVRPMVTWHGAVATLHPRWVGEFIATSPRAGDAHTLEVDLEPSIDARCVHLVVVSLPSGLPLGGVALRCETSAGAARRAADGSTEAVSGVDGRAVLCWPEDATLRIEAEGHTVRKLTWADAQRPVEQLAQTSMAAAEAHVPFEVELAALGAVHGESLPVWFGAGRIYLNLLQPKRGEYVRSPVSAILEGSESWRLDGVPTWVGEGPERAFGASTDVPTFGVAWHGARANGTSFVYAAPLTTSVTLEPGEARQIIPEWSNDVVELDLLVTIDGALARAGTRLEVVRRPALSGTEDRNDARPAARLGDNQEALLQLRLSQMLREALRLALTVEADGHVRVPALPPGTYDVTTSLSEREELIEVGIHSAAARRQSASGVLEVPAGSHLTRVTSELSLQLRQ